MTLPDDVSLVVNPDREYLNARQLEDYFRHLAGIPMSGSRAVHGAEDVTTASHTCLMH